MQTGGPSEEDVVVSEGGAIDRVRGFSDGVFAVAITLLVLNIEVPRGSGASLGEVLGDLGPYVLSYFIAFLVIGMFWYGHHLSWDSFARSTPAMVWANIVLLSLIVLIPFTTSLINEYSEPEAFAIFAGNIGLAALLDTLCDWIAYRQGVVDPESPYSGRSAVLAGLTRAAVFLLSVPLAWVDPSLAQLSWALLLFLPRLASRLGAGEGDGGPPSEGRRTI